MTRALTMFMLAVFGGLLLWWHAAMVGTAIYSAASGSVTMSMVRDVLSLLPAFVYTVVVWGTFFAVRFAYVGWPVCIVVVGLLSWRATGRCTSPHMTGPASSGTRP